MRIDSIASKVQSLLDRLTPPASMQGKAAAQADEAAALIRAVDTHAPDIGFEDWWITFEDALLGNRRARVWPSLAAFHDAGRAAGSSAKGPNHAIAAGHAAMRPGWHMVEGRVQIDDVVMTAQRMNDGQPVPEPALYGVLAADIEERDLVTADVLARRRKAAFMARRETYGHEAAVAWETERKAHHRRIMADRRPVAAGEEWVA